MIHEDHDIYHLCFFHPSVSELSMNLIDRFVFSLCPCIFFSLPSSYCVAIETIITLLTLLGAQPFNKIGAISVCLFVLLTSSCSYQLHLCFFFPFSSESVRLVQEDKCIQHRRGILSLWLWESAATTTQSTGGSRAGGWVWGLSVSVAEPGSSSQVLRVGGYGRLKTHASVQEQPVTDI